MSIRRKSFLGKNDDLTRSNSIMKRVSNRSEKKSFKVVVVGAAGVGKSALTVRAKTRKFIHDYAPNMESRVSFVSNIDEESVNVEVWDTAALQTAESEKLEEKIKWADAYILVYSITDAASLSALVASKCLINLYAKKRKKSVTSSGGSNGFLVALVGNKNDMKHERMVTEETGRVFAEVHECTHFFELSTRESYDSVKTVFESLYKAYNLRSQNTQ
ncbi:hypothetical protein EB796_016966 [Bugula neritina]|uniref:small monomeric GTPase n=1 Tax=Bugula neritina TaxID=10212 RepID=A0A7J7JGH5_BUGNE|nr:hypothetical protein EB796_016966 [Bugula neritina]